MGVRKERLQLRRVLNCKAIPWWKSLEINVMINALNRLMLPYPAQDGTPGSAQRIAPLLSTSDFLIMSRFPLKDFFLWRKFLCFFRRPIKAIITFH